MNDMPTSPVEPSARTPAPTTSIVAEWRHLGAFLKRPTLAPAAPGTPALATVLRIYALDMGIMFVLVGIAALVVTLGVDLPETALAGIEITWLIALGVIVAAPVFEEILFRSWLSGKLGHILALLAIVAGGTVFVAFNAGVALLGALAPLLGVVAAITALVMLRGRPPMGWFARVFPLFFWGSTLAFALIHLGNFDPEDAGGSLAMLLPLVIPQFVLGALLGYLRVRIGLWAAILLHALHNATALGIAALAMNAA